MTETTVRQANILAAALGVLETLEFYADPESYFALTVLGDPPCGEFMRDAAPLTEADKLYYEDYRGDDGGYYGEKAREALAAWRKAHAADG